MKHDFEDIEVKRNASSLLESQLHRKRKPCMIGTGAMSDPYIHLENELQVTRQCLSLIEKYGFGLAIQTKSTPYGDSKEMLYASHKKVMDMIEHFSNEELFESKHFSWTGTSTLGAYCVSATSSHYDWAMKKIKAHIKAYWYRVPLYTDQN